MSPSRTLRIATRRSPLALWQANTVKRLLEQQGYKIELNLVVTSGDKMQRGALADVAIDDPHIPEHLKTGKGLFVKEVQEAILADQADLAVHSMKDLPVENTAGLRVAAVLPRANPGDTIIFSPALLSTVLNSGKENLQEVQPEKVFQLLNSIDWSVRPPVGTTSARRQAFLRHSIPNLSASLQVLRGNVDSRLKRVTMNEFAFIMLARAGIDRLELHNPSSMLTLPISLSVPAPAQGVVAVECRETDTELHRALCELNDCNAAMSAALERAVLWYTGSGCHTALASHYENGVLNCWVADQNKKCALALKLTDAELTEWRSVATVSDYSSLFRALTQSQLGERMYSELLRHNFNSLVTMQQKTHD